MEMNLVENTLKNYSNERHKLIKSRMIFLEKHNKNKAIQINKKF